MKFTLDAARFGGAPLTKKFAMFHSGLVPMDRYRRDMYRFDAVAPRSLRADLFIGEPHQPFGQVVQGDENNITYDFAQLDELVRMLLERGVLPYWSWCYMPLPVQTRPDFRCGPSNMQVWAGILEHFAAHYREQGLRLGHQEVYNEPDCFDVFFTGSYDDYIRMYEAGAPALRRGDPDAVVGGPSTAFVFDDDTQRRNLTKFVRSVRENRLPLDFFSYHSYGWEKDVYCRRTDIVREVLGNDPYFKSTELHMNELNVVPSPWGYEDEGGRLLGSLTMLPLVFDAMRKLAEYTDLTLVHWAQLLESGVDALGLVDANGKLRPAYAAFEIYERMPVRRLELALPGVQTLASADANRVSVVLWGAQNETSLELDWANLPFAEGTAAVHVLDAAFFRTYDGRLPADAARPVTGEPICLTLQPDTVAYIEINRADAAHSAKDCPHRCVRTHYYFEDRAKNTISWFDEHTHTAVLGMGGNEEGLAVCASEMDVQGDALRIETAAQDMADQAYCAVRLDFAAENGYVSSAVYTNRLDGEYPALPLGTGRAPDAVHAWQGGDLTVALRQQAPEDWNGRLLVTWLLKDAGPNSWLELKLR